MVTNSRVLGMSRIDKLREELGGAHPAAANKIRDFIEPYIKAFIENSPFAVMASSNAEGDCDASPKGGTPGFIKVLDQKTLLIPDIGGNRLFQSFQNFESNPKAGFIFMIPGVSVTARVNGTISVIDEAEMEHRNIAPELNHPDDNANLIQGMLLNVDESYFHCPRSMQFADLWNTATIITNADKSLKDLMTTTKDAS